MPFAGHIYPNLPSVFTAQDLISTLTAGLSDLEAPTVAWLCEKTNQKRPVKRKTPLTLVPNKLYNGSFEAAQRSHIVEDYTTARGARRRSPDATDEQIGGAGEAAVCNREYGKPFFFIFVVAF